MFVPRAGVVSELLAFVSVALVLLGVDAGWVHNWPFKLLLLAVTAIVWIATRTVVRWLLAFSRGRLAVDQPPEGRRALPVTLWQLVASVAVVAVWHFYGSFAGISTAVLALLVHAGAHTLMRRSS